MIIVTKKKPITPNESAFEWVQHAHKLYITARFIFMNGFHYNGILIGAHALEIYLKAFIIHETRTYIKGHDLADYYRKCMELNSFFRDERLSRYFLPQKASKALAHELWGNYVPNLRYPELLPGENKTSGFLVHSGSDTAGTFESLDRVAHFMYKTIPIDTGIKRVISFIVTGESKEIVGSVIDDFLKGNGYYWSLGTRENAPELIEILEVDPIIRTG